MDATEAAVIREREVRLGIVLYGGVSLAIYENGVAQELFRAVQGEGIYSFIKYLIDSDIVVDIVSGTSAGGINGILLGYALANGRDFRTCSRLWREDGDLLLLLRDPNKDAASLLDSGGYYQERLESAFDGMPVYLPPGNDGVAPGERIASQVREVDVFVTGTDIEGHTYTVFDEAGHPIDVKDHRSVFLLSYRSGGRKNEFEIGRSAALAKLARITSCFPVAFEPVEVTAEDDLLRRWGKLDSRKSIFFLDGGVLNNKPFSYTIDSILRRTADRDVDRMVLYVEPDPERFQRETPLKGTPNVAQSALNAVVGIPGYQSIASDLQSITEHNDRVQLYRDLLGCLPGAPDEPPAQTDEGQPVARGASLITSDDWDTIGDSACRVMYQAARLNQLRDRAVEGILKRTGQRKLLLRPDERHAAVILVQSFNEWDPQPDAAGSKVAEKTLRTFDVYYRMRRLLDLCEFIKTSLYPDQARTGRLQERERKTLTELWKRINHQFKLLEEIQFCMESAIDAAPVPWEDLKNTAASAKTAQERWQMAMNVLLAVLDTRDVKLRAAVATQPESEEKRRQAEFEERADLIAALKIRVEKMGRPEAVVACKRTPLVQGNLLLRCDKLERTIIRGLASHAAAARYANFLLIDSYVFPMMRMARMESVEPIRTTRISPIDAQRAYSAQPLDAKLCGDALGHFGGFLKRSWRANDTMWGRLDGLCQLVECLVTQERMNKVSPKSITLGQLRQMFPQSTEALLDGIQKLVPRLHEASKNEFDQFLDALVRAAQSEILEEEVPRVIDAAIRQHADWNQFPVLRPSSPLISENQVWRVSPKRLDAAVTGYASAQLSLTAVPAGGWSRYFEDVYRVGSESWREGIPPPIVGEMAAHSLLVLADCLLRAAGPSGEKVTRSLVYLSIRIPIKLVYRFMRLQRTAPEYAWVAYIVLALSAAILVIELQPMRTWLFGKTATSPAYPWILIPAGILLGSCVFALYILNSRRRPVEKPAQGILQALAGTLALPQSEVDSLALNARPWDCAWFPPGSLIAPDGTPSRPAEIDKSAPFDVGPVLPFCAQEKVGRNLHNALLTSLLSGWRVRPTRVRVDGLRIFSPSMPLEVLLAQNRPDGLETENPAIVAAAVYEGTLVFTCDLTAGFTGVTKDQEEGLRRAGFRLQHTPSADRLRSIGIVSTAPVCFACRRREAALVIEDGRESVILREPPSR